jgi:hypothetical protein
LSFPAKAAQEAMQEMRRVCPLILVVVSLYPASGCGGLGWYRSIGNLPGVAASDYAFYDFCGTSSQLYPLTPDQVESSMFEALGDLGFKAIQPPIHNPDNEVLIKAKTADGRPTNITIVPQNTLTNAKVSIGPVHVGDQDLSHDLLRRVSLNFGTLPRTYTPMDSVLPRRFNTSPGIPPRIERPPPPPLVGDGLRPTDSRDQQLGNEDSGLDPSVPVTNLPSPFRPPGRFTPTRDNPNPPNMPFSPFPYVPFDNP